MEVFLSIFTMGRRGTKGLARLRLRQLRRNAMDMDDTWENVLDYILSVNERRFETEGFGTWDPLEDATIERKERLGLDARVLHESLRLRESLTDRDSPDMEVEISRDSLYMASLVPYGEIHRQGAPGSNIPIRVPMELSSGHRSWITKLVKDGILYG
jgi:hypothetical protein